MRAAKGQFVPPDAGPFGKANIRGGVSAFLVATAFVACTAGVLPTDAPNAATPFLPPSAQLLQPAETSSPGAAPTRTWAPASAWTAPVKLSDLKFQAVALAVDGTDSVHIAAVPGQGPGQHGLTYMTNQGGSWTTELVSSLGESTVYASPSIAVDADGAVWIAFVRNHEAGLVTKASGRWAEPVFVGGPSVVETAIAVHDGVAHLIYRVSCGSQPTDAQCTDDSLFYVRVEREATSPRRIINFTHSALLALDSSGSPATLAQTGREVPIRMTAAFATSGWQTEDVWRSPPMPATDALPLALGATANGGAAAVWDWWDWGANADIVSYATLTNGSWSEPVDALPGVVGRSAAVSPNGAIHVVGFGGIDGYDSYAYWSSSGGPFATRTLASGVSDAGGHFLTPYGTIAVSVDQADRPHIAYLDFRDWPASTGLWYVRGPAPIGDH